MLINLKILATSIFKFVEIIGSVPLSHSSIRVWILFLGFFWAASTFHNMVKQATNSAGHHVSILGTKKL